MASPKHMIGPSRKTKDRNGKAARMSNICQGIALTLKTDKLQNIQARQDNFLKAITCIHFKKHFLKPSYTLQKKSNKVTFRHGLPFPHYVFTHSLLNYRKPELQPSKLNNFKGKYVELEWVVLLINIVQGRLNSLALCAKFQPFLLQSHLKCSQDLFV